MKFLKDGFLRKVNLGLEILFSLTGVVLLVLSLVDHETWNKTASYVVTIFLPLLPFVLEKVHLKLSDKLVFFGLIFAIAAMIFGIDFDWYKTLYIFGNPCYDKIMHTLSGVVMAFVAKEVLDKFYDGKDEGARGKTTRVRKYSRFFAGLFIVSFVALTAAGWECYEFLYDQIFGGHMQELIVQGVADTMWDILGALAAGIVVAVPLSKK